MPATMPAKVRELATMRECAEAFRSWIRLKLQDERDLQDRSDWDNGYWRAMDDAADILEAALAKPDVGR